MNGLAAFAPFLRAFVTTQLVEVPIYVRCAPIDARRAFAASLITHPIVWFVFFSPRVPLVYEAKLAAAETFAVVAEALWLVAIGIRARRAFVVSLLANASSVIVGTITRALFGWP